MTSDAKTMKILPTLYLALTLGFTASAADQVTDWHGFQRLNFSVEGKACFITQPAIAAAGKPWVWRTSFPDFHAEVDLELLRHGWAVGYLECLDLLGCDAALDLMDQFYTHATEQRGFGRRPALKAVSRGGLHAYRYAARHPDRIACVYADTPVMDLKSWPLGWGGASQQTAEALRFYGFNDEAELRAYRGNPVDLLEPIARAKIPLRHVISLNDRGRFGDVTTARVISDFTLDPRWQPADGKGRPGRAMSRSPRWWLTTTPGSRFGPRSSSITLTRANRGCTT